MITSTDKAGDKFNFSISEDMLDGKLDKDQNNLRLYIITSFRDEHCTKFMASMKKIDFERVLKELREYVFICD